MTNIADADLETTSSTMEMKKVEDDGSPCVMPEKPPKQRRQPRGQRWKKRKNIQQETPEKKPHKRGRRGCRRNVTDRATWKLIIGLLASILTDTTIAAPAPMLGLHAPISQATHWAVTPQLPVFQMMTWRHQPIPLITHGNVSFLSEPWSNIPIVELNKEVYTISFHAPHAPMCLTYDDQDWPFCPSFKYWEIIQDSHTDLDLNNFTTSMWVNIFAIHRDNLSVYHGNTTIKTSHLPPCSHRSLGMVFGPMISCLTGEINHAMKIGDEKLVFWDKHGKNLPELVAPTPIVEGTPQTQIWKVGLALKPTMVRINISNPLDKDLTFGQWYKVFQNKNSTCHHNIGNNSILCYNFTGRIHTLDNAAFLICNSPSITKEKIFRVHREKANITNTIRSNQLKKGDHIFLLRVPPYTVHTVQAEPFATSFADEVIGKILEKGK